MIDQHQFVGENHIQMFDNFLITSLLLFPLIELKIFHKGERLVKFGSYLERAFGWLKFGSEQMCADVNSL